MKLFLLNFILFLNIILSTCIPIDIFPENVESSDFQHTKFGFFNVEDRNDALGEKTDENGAITFPPPILGLENLPINATTPETTIMVDINNTLPAIAPANVTEAPIAVTIPAENVVDDLSDDTVSNIPKIILYLYSFRLLLMKKSMATTKQKQPMQKTRS